MSTSPLYLLDANVFIEAARRYYAFDLVPRFWTSLDRLAQQGRIRSVDRVKAELEKGHDELSDWAANKFADGFVSTDEPEIIVEFRTIMAWVTKQTQFTEEVRRRCRRLANCLREGGSRCGCDAGAAVSGCAAESTDSECV